MKKRPLIVAISFFVFLLMLGCQTPESSKPAVASKQPFTSLDWKLQSAFGSKLPVIGGYGRIFSRRIAVDSNGAIKISFHEPGSIVKPLEIFDAVRRDKIEIGYTSPAYSAAKNQAFVIFAGLPFGPAAEIHYVWMREGGGMVLYDELYGKYDVKGIPCVMNKGEGLGWFRKAINTPSSLKGLKMRFFGLGAKVMKRLGVSTQLLAGADIYPALERGVIDATEFSTPYIDQSLGFYRIAKYYYYPSWHQPFQMFDIIMSKQRWQSLSAQLQRSILDSCHNNVIASLEEDQRLRQPALKDFKRRGVNVLPIPESITDAARKAWQEVVRDQSYSSKDFARIYAAYSKYLSRHGKTANMAKGLRLVATVH